MKRLLVALLLAPALCAAVPSSKLLKGVESPLRLELDGKTLELNGMGVRTKVVFKVYVGSLYLEKTSADGNAIAASEQVKRMELAFLRGVSGEDVVGAISAGFNANAGDSLPALSERMQKFTKLIPDVKKGDRLAFVYRPGAGLEVQANGKKTGEIPGKDFSDALFRVWLGDKPADGALKAGLLGK